MKRDCRPCERSHKCFSPLACATFGYCRVLDLEKPYDALRDARWSWADAVEAIRNRKIEAGEITP
jgi:hypothetical protein